MLYEFQDNGGFSFLMEIDADLPTIKQLLDQYRNSDPNYDEEGWKVFLDRRRITSKFIEIDNIIPF